MAGWAAIPPGLLFDAEISDRAVRLFGLVQTHTDGLFGRTIEPLTDDELCAQLGCSQRVLSRARKELRDAGWCEIMKLANGKLDYQTNESQSPHMATGYPKTTSDGRNVATGASLIGRRDNKKRKRSQIPEGWAPSTALMIETLEAARDAAKDIDWNLQLRKFRAHWESKGDLRASWDATWRTWFLNAIEWADAPPIDDEERIERRYNDRIAELRGTPEGIE